MIRRILAAAAAAILVLGGWVAPARAAATGTVTGSFRTLAGEPIARASVIVYSGTDQWRGSGYTDAAGHFEITGVTAGPVKVKFSESLIEQYAYQAGDAATATLLTLPDGGTLTVDETRRPAGTIEGTFRTTEGDPVKDALVSAYTLGNRILSTKQTGPDGRYRLERMPAGPVKLKFDRHNLVQWAHQAPDFAAATPIDVAADQVTVADETQLPAGTIRGTISGPDGGPPADFFVSAFRVGATGSSIHADMSADGSYSISVPAGQWRVRVQSDVTGDQWVPQATEVEDATVFTVATGQTVVVDETQRARGAIEGVLKYSGGRPVSDETVKVWRDGEVVASKYNDDDGGYHFGGLEPGVYLVSWENSDDTETYVPGTLRLDQADRITVRAGEVTTANTRDQASAVVRGTLTTPDGAPAPSISVRVDAVAGGRAYGAITGPDGTWEISGIDPEDYRVSFRSYASGLVQYAYGTADAGQAEVFTLAPGSLTTVNDAFVLGGTLRVTATDAVDGSPAPGFCVSLPRSSGYCTTGDTVSVAGVSPGPTTINVGPLSSSDYLGSGPVPVTVADGGITPLTVPLNEGGRVAVEVVDRATGVGRKQWCVVLAVPGEGGVPDGTDWGCTHKNGKITTYAVPAGTYQMFVSSTDAQGLGAQWVGENGGTGDQKQAVKFKVKVGKTTRLPQVLLDRGGDVRGIVRGPDGAPLAGVNVGVNAWPLGGTPPFYESFSDGTFRVYSLGPYPWPLIFTKKDGSLPRQMSGGTGNRFQAETVTVRPIDGANPDITLVTGARLTGTVTVAPGQPAFTGGRITAVNAATGDVLAIADFTGQGGTYDMPIIGGGAVLLRWSLTGGPAASGQWDDRVSVPRSGTRTLDLTIP